MAHPEAMEGTRADDLPDHALYGGSGSPLRPGVYHQIGQKGREGTIDEVVAASGRSSLEEAYLFFMGEEELL